MESRFGYDFSRVRVHTGTRAAHAARSMNAEAYTLGSHIVFAAGRYAPATRRGRDLLVHELTHVVQQENGFRAGGAEAAEKEAERNEARADAPEALSFNSPAPLIARKADESTTMQAPTSAPDCTGEQHKKIYPAAQLAIQWLDRSIEKLTAFISAPTADANKAAAGAMQRHFHSTDPAIAQRVLERVQLIRHDIDALREQDVQLSVECHTDQDQVCGQSNAYVTGDRNTLVFCPIFFTWSLERRAESIVHEMAHSIVGGAAHPTDRGYDTDRVLPYLNTAEALTNAESYGLLVQEMGTGHVPQLHPPNDSVESACREIEPLLRLAIGRAQRWNRAGETRVMGQVSDDMLQLHLGAHSQQTRKAAYDFYHGASSGLAEEFKFVCNRDCGRRLAFGEKAADRSFEGIGIGVGIGVGLGLIVGGILGALIPGLGVGLGLLGGGLIGLAAGLIGGAIGGAIASHGPRIHICPGWKDQSESARIESVLAAAYEALGHSQDDSLKYARLAGAISAELFPAPNMEDIDRSWIEDRLRRVRVRLEILRARYRHSSDAFAASIGDERERDYVERFTRQEHARARDDRQLWGGSYTGERIRRAVTATASGNTVTLRANLQITYLSLSDAEGRARAATDIPRIESAIREVWQLTFEHGDYAGMNFRMIPSVTYLAPGAPRSENAFLIQVRGPDSDPSSGDGPTGIISLALAHLDGRRVIVIAHELAHLFGFTDTYFTMTERGQQTLFVGRSDPQNRADLLGDIDPVGLEREQRAGHVTAQDVARQTGPVHVWEEEAGIVLQTLGVAPPRPAPDSENFDPDVELDRIRGEREAELTRIRERRARIEDSMKAVSLAEEILHLEEEERDLSAKLAAMH